MNQDNEPTEFKGGLRRREFIKVTAAFTLCASFPELAEAKPGPSADYRLFPTDLPENKWTHFQAHGYTNDVCGVIFRHRKPECGVPMGGIGTGCIDIEADGTLGYCTAFSPVWGHGDGEDGGRMYRDRILDEKSRPMDLNDPSRGKMNVPFLGLTLGDTVWVLTTAKNVEKVKQPKGIDYWGHYPVADLEFALDGPVEVGLRAWSAFIPGDSQRSSVPGAIFEVHLRNKTPESQKGSLVFSFPGPRKRETQDAGYVRQEVKAEDFAGIHVSATNGIGYVLACIEPDGVRTGSGLGTDWEKWSRIGGGPDVGEGSPDPKHGCASVMVNFQLLPQENKVVRFLLAWYAPTWQSSWAPGNISNTFTRMYAVRFRNAIEVARYIAKNHQALLNSILAWQQVIYAKAQLPGWLRDGLINILHLITEESYWAQAKPPIGDWCSAKDGLFSLVEGTDADGQQSCIPCDWYGNLPIVYFFPELARSTLRAYTDGQRADGCVPMTLGQGLNLTGSYQYEYQRALNPCVYVDLVDRLWLRTGDDGVLKEFYPAVKKTTDYVMNLITGPDSVISSGGQEWYEAMGIIGKASHVAGVRLAHLRMVERMAEKMGDKAFAKKCRKWRQEGSAALESKLWSGTHYLLYDDPATRVKSDLILAFQLDGEWMADFHGLPGVFLKDRVARTLETIKIKNGSLTECGLIDIVQSDGQPTSFGARMGGLCTMPASVFITAMNYFYEGDAPAGLEIAFKCLNNLVNEQGMAWDMPNIVRGDRGHMRRVYGFDYYQCMSLWGLPAAIEGTDLSGPVKPGGLVDRVLRAAGRKTVLQGI